MSDFLALCNANICKQPVKSKQLQALVKYPLWAILTASNAPLNLPETGNGFGLFTFGLDQIG